MHNIVITLNTEGSNLIYSKINLIINLKFIYAYNGRLSLIDFTSLQLIIKEISYLWRRESNNN